MLLIVLSTPGESRPGRRRVTHSYSYVLYGPIGCNTACALTSHLWHMKTPSIELVKQSLGSSDSYPNFSPNLLCWEMMGYPGTVADSRTTTVNESESGRGWQMTTQKFKHWPLALAWNNELHRVLKFIRQWRHRTLSATSVFLGIVGFSSSRPMQLRARFS